MKRLTTLLLAAGLMLGAVHTANAADIKASGYWQFGFSWADMDFGQSEGKDTFKALQRLRTKVDIITSENLRGVMFFEVGKSTWGQQSGGAALGTDGYTVKVRYSYVDWVVPNTDLKVRMGLQPWLMPGFAMGSNVLDADGAGITMSYQFNDMVGVTLGWLRAENDNTSNNVRHNALDLVALTVPVTGDGFKVTPWAMYGFVGNSSLSGNTGGDIGDLKYGMLPVLKQGIISGSSMTDDKHGDAWWAGITGELTMFDPFRLAFDANYGSVDMGAVQGSFMPGQISRTIDVKRAGWYLGLVAEYKLDYMTPGLVLWYASGDDSNPYNGSERMPALEAAFKGTAFGYDAGWFDGYDVLGKSAAGTWGAGLRLNNISFMDDLSHGLQVSYIQGTNSKNMPSRAAMNSFHGDFNDTTGTAGFVYMTTKDSAWEVDFNTKYKIYEDLTFMLEMGYIRLDMDDNVWSNPDYSKNAYKVGAYMRYDF